MSLEDLIERVEGATGASREIDWLISEHLGDVPEHRVIEIGWDYVWHRRPGEYTLWKALDGEGRSVTHWSPPAVTASLDAVLALCERVLSGAQWDLERDAGATVVSAAVYGPEPLHGFPARYWAVKETAALALLSALLRALLSKEPTR
jgi:hypothetical protein